MTNEAETKMTAVTPSVAAAPPKPAGRSAIMTLADRLGVEPGDLFLRSLKQVAFKAPDVSHEQLMALVVVANQYKLNPFTRELYAYPDKKTGGIVPVVSIDGWLRIINEHDQMDGLEYSEANDDEGRYGECIIYRKDRKIPYKLREYLKEVMRNTDPWLGMPKRMLRHKTIIQTGRVAFGFAGIYDQDEAERIIGERPQQQPLDTQGVAKLAALLGTEPKVDPAFVSGVVQSEQPRQYDEMGGTLPPDDAADIRAQAERADAEELARDRERALGSGELPI